jgi:[ribosomal protein S18]-alanine N-acetyltransferase
VADAGEAAIGGERAFNARLAPDLTVRRVAFQFRPMTQEDAEAVARWHYPEPFSFYDWETDDLPELLDPGLRSEDLVAVDDDSGNLVGFFHYKPPHHPSLEIGLGLHPDWTGRGLGQSFVEAGLDYARRRYAPEEFRLSVAAFNRRAITVYERVGFVSRRTYTHWTLGRDWEFIEMRRSAELADG